MEVNRYTRFFGVSIEIEGPQQQQPQQQPPPLPATMQNNEESKKKRLMVLEPQSLPQPYRDFIKEKWGSEEAKLLLCKRVNKTDTSHHHARLAMPSGQLKHNELLTEEEEEYVQQTTQEGKRKLCKKLDVLVVDPSMEIRTMIFTRWNAGTDAAKTADKKKSWWYALSKGWNNLVEHNKLVEGDSIQVWSLRINSQLAFIIYKIDEPARVSSDAAVASTSCKRRKLTIN